MPYASGATMTTPPPDSVRCGFVYPDGAVCKASLALHAEWDKAYSRKQPHAFAAQAGAFDEVLKRRQASTQHLKDSVDESTRLTAEDYAMRINTRPEDEPQPRDEATKAAVASIGTAREAYITCWKCSGTGLIQFGRTTPETTCDACAGTRLTTANRSRRPSQRLVAAMKAAYAQGAADQRQGVNPDVDPRDVALRAAVEIIDKLIEIADALNPHRMSAHCEREAREWREKYGSLVEGAMR